MYSTRKRSREASCHLLRAVRCLSVLILLQFGRGNLWADALDSWIWRNPLPHAQYVYGLTRGDGLWISYGVNGVIATSPDGAEWDVSNLGVNTPVVGGAYGNGVYVVTTPSRGLFVSRDAHCQRRRENGVNLAV